jgi:hypothetical protein
MGLFRRSAAPGQPEAPAPPPAGAPAEEPVSELVGD